MEMLSELTVVAHAGWYEVALLGALPLAVVAIWHTVERRRRPSPDGRDDHGRSERRLRSRGEGPSRKRP